MFSRIIISFILLLFCSSASAQWQFYRYTKPDSVYVNFFKTIDGPAPTDTARNAENGIYKQFFSEIEKNSMYFGDYNLAEYSSFKKLPLLRYKRQSLTVLIIGIAVLLFVIIRFNFTRDIIQIIDGAFKNRVFVQVTRDNSLLTSQSVILFLSLAALVFGYSLYLLFYRVHVTEFTIEPQNYIILSAAVLAFILSKIFILRLMGFIFNLKPIVSNYILVLYIGYAFFAIFLLPVLVLHLLGPVSWAGFLQTILIYGIVILILYQLIRGIYFSLKNFQFPLVYLILYLCIFEICPLMILYKSLLQ